MRQYNNTSETSKCRTSYVFHIQTHACDQQLVLEFLFEQRKISQIQTSNESSTDKYTRKVKQNERKLKGS